MADVRRKTPRLRDRLAGTVVEPTKVVEADVEAKPVITVEELVGVPVKRPRKPRAKKVVEVEAPVVVEGE